MRTTVRMQGPLDGGAGLMLHDAGAGDHRREDGDGSVQLDGREREHGMGARDGEAAGASCALGVGMQRHQRRGGDQTYRRKTRYLETNPSASATSCAEESCTATEIRCATNVIHVRADHVVSSYSEEVSLLARQSDASRSAS